MLLPKSICEMKVLTVIPYTFRKWQRKERLIGWLGRGKAEMTSFRKGGWVSGSNSPK